MKLLLDTGYFKSVIDASLIPPDSIQQWECVSMQCTHGDLRPYPTAIVGLEVDGKIYTLKVAGMGSLPRCAFLGRDVKDLVKMIMKEDEVHNHQVLAVRSRHQQYEKEKEEAIQLMKVMTPQATPTSIGDAFNFADDIYIGDGKARKSRYERRQLKRECERETEEKNEDNRCKRKRGADKMAKS